MDDNENKIKDTIRGTGPVRVLSLGHVEDLLWERHRLLGAAGFEVTSVDTRSEALKLLDNQDVNVLVIGHRVPVEQRNELAIKAKIWRRAAVIFLYKGNIHKAEFADAVLSIDRCSFHTIQRDLDGESAPRQDDTEFIVQFLESQSVKRQDVTAGKTEQERR